MPQWKAQACASKPHLTTRSGTGRRKLLHNTTQGDRGSRSKDQPRQSRRLWGWWSAGLDEIAKTVKFLQEEARLHHFDTKLAAEARTVRGSRRNAVYAELHYAKALGDDPGRGLESPQERQTSLHQSHPRLECGGRVGPSALADRVRR